MRIYNKKGLKEAFEKNGMKIGNIAIDKMIEKKEKEMNLEIEKIIRNALILGRKVVKIEDIF